jgi:hypothetical protein
MPYVPTNWQNTPSTATPIDATNLNKLETQYGVVADDIFSGATTVDGALDSRYPAVEGDTGWVTITTNGGFGAHATYPPKVRRIGKILLFKGGWTSAGLSSGGTFSVGTLPVGYYPTELIIATPGTAITSDHNTVRIQSDGIIQILTNTVLSSYYFISGLSGTID